MSTAGERAAASAAGPLVIASNRLPVRLAEAGRGRFRLAASDGGLVAALAGMGVERQWVGWPGAVVPRSQEAALRTQLARRGLHPVLLDRGAEAGYYGRMCNEVLWPLFHGLPGRARDPGGAWHTYARVNECFADVLAEQAPPGAQVWVHDFHLLLVPAALRRRRPDVAIGFFLHIPFPPAALFGLLPRGGELLAGLLGADAIGFHTSAYVHHFRSACLQLLGAASTPTGIARDGRLVQLAADPAGIDNGLLRGALHHPAFRAQAALLEERLAGRRLVLGVDRLDYAKGVPQKLRAFERYLEAAPERAGTTLLVQVLVPSRLQSAGYRDERQAIQQECTRINARFGAARPVVECIHGALPLVELAALYRRADVMAVTPLCDGMNLVAQEFAACQAAAPGLPGRARGALVLSEFAGAAQHLPGALLVDPADVAGTAARLGEALELTPCERTRRLDLLGAAVERLDSAGWAARCLARIPGGAADRYAAAGRSATATSRLPAGSRSVMPSPAGST